MLKNIFRLLFPDLCLGCKSLLLYNETTLCSSCRHNLPFTKHHLIKNNDTTKIFYGIVAIEFGISMLYFNKKGIVQNLIHRLKYKGNQEIGSLLGNMYAPDIKPLLDNYSNYEIIPVPLHKKKLRERGYNQVTTFCLALSENLKIPINKSILYRNHYTSTQTKKNKLLRGVIKKEVFDVKYCNEDIGKHYILVDDVITTGATLEACAKVLLKIPNAKISIVTIAFTQL